MSLDEELRATLGLEAERRTAPPPDVVGLVRGGRVRRRRRNLVRAGVAVAATAVVGATAFGVVSLDPRAGELTTQPSPPPELETMSDDGRATLAPGTYRMFVARGRSGASVSVDVTVAGPHWKQGDFPIVSDPSETMYAGFGVYQPQALASGNGCETGPTLAALARTPTGLAAQLASLPRSTVLQQPEPATVVGLSAIHLRLRIDVDCPGFYRVAHASGGTRGITYTLDGLVPPGVLIDFWVLERDGAVVVVDEWHNTDAPPEVVRQAREARRSITFVAS